MCRGVELISITSNWLQKRQKVSFRSQSHTAGRPSVKPARSLHSEGVAAVDSAHVPHHNPVVVGAGWETGSDGVRPSHLQTRVQGGDLLNRKFPCCSWKRRTDRDLRLARNSPYARLFLGWMSLTTPLFPPAARMLQGWAEPRSPPDISTVDQAREKNSCSSRGQRRPSISCYAHALAHVHL